MSCRQAYLQKIRILSHRAFQMHADSFHKTGMSHLMACSRTGAAVSRVSQAGVNVSAH